jgi:hypothetical protein
MGQELVGLVVKLGERGSDGGPGKTGTAGSADGGAGSARVKGTRRANCGTGGGHGVRIQVWMRQ